ncbi:hypothetical protein SAMN04488034_101540 [Salinimicrobium catena]|uniref:Uncharacterized protein n=1 Tax=Salinimicrobium catena TaxID=390640 RepID=A0A1H5IV82_9FLAO|nr:hypothetical protein [Salinimicrobium catena]SDK81180.1 hypothetical protein SAMN04488140_101539 [Salinimicrobium catena]SEE44183.1 hypothetical protein SAMN04488034_101540 [Salinimicrobium catena]
MKVMKKQLKEELVTLAEKIMVLKGHDAVSTGELRELARQLYDKLTILNFTESNLFTSEEKKEENELVHTAERVKSPQEKRTAEAAEETEEDEYAPTGMEYNDSEAITEPNTEKIKDIVAQMPPETRQVDELFEHVQPKNYQKNDMKDIGGVHYDQLPQFEPVSSNGQHADKPRSLNDRLKKGIHIGVNDRHAFIKHLFDGSTADYNRVLSQLNTIKSKEEALNFVANMVKPDYNNWEGKEDYESRFLAIVEKKFE